jgi:hypothetical protein
MPNSDFTLYFLAYDHDGAKLSPEELHKTRFKREGGFLPSFLSLYTIPRTF